MEEKKQTCQKCKIKTYKLYSLFDDNKKEDRTHCIKCKQKYKQNVKEIIPNARFGKKEWLTEDLRKEAIKKTQ